MRNSQTPWDQSPGPPIRAVIFDVGNTLLFPNYALIAELLSGYGVGVDADRLYDIDRLRRSEGNRRAMAGEETEGFWASYWHDLFAGLGLSEDEIASGMDEVAIVNDRIDLWEDRWPGTRSVLLNLRAADLPLGIVSNSDGRVQAYLRKTGLFDLFETVIDSHCVGVRKPSGEIFRLATSQLGLDPSACLYVGDVYPIDMIGAWKAGLQAALLSPSASGERLPLTVAASLDEIPSLVSAGVVGPPALP